MLFHVAAHTVAPFGFARCSFRAPRRQCRLALAVGDAVKGLAGLFHGVDVLHHRGLRPSVNMAFSRASTAFTSVFHSGCRRACGAAFHPGGKASVEPQVIRPGHGHQVAKPLVRNLVRSHLEHTLLVVRAAVFGSNKIACSKLKMAPSFPWRQRTGCALELPVVPTWAAGRARQVVVVLGQHGLGGVQHRFAREPVNLSW